MLRFTHTTNGRFAYVVIPFFKQNVARQKRCPELAPYFLKHHGSSFNYHPQWESQQFGQGARLFLESGFLFLAEVLWRR